MDRYQRAGIRAVWEVFRPLLYFLAIIAVFAGIALAVARLTNSVIRGILVGEILSIAAVLGWMIWDAYRHGVRQLKEEEQRDAKARAEWSDELEAGLEQLRRRGK